VNPDEQLAQLQSAAAAAVGGELPLIEPVFESEFPLIESRFEEEEGTVALPGWKRALDVTCILLSLALWLPVFGLIALWIKIVSPGPLFFRQDRAGFRGMPFRIWKFRTMKENADSASHEALTAALMSGGTTAAGPMTKLDRDDPRIIAGGRILRASGLDELPQLINVLRGEMSLVGPRPCTLYEFRRYTRRARERFTVVPGLTGWWQVNGKNRTTFVEMVEMDVWYTRNRSFGLDLAIMCRTAPALWRQVLEKKRSVTMR
jgi:lipopolysaccharide/colanic/teichoic acid biosynthesis glycosyltransferase